MSSDGKTFNTDITADPSAFISGMQAAAQGSTQAASKIKQQFDSVGKAFETVQKQLLLITAIVGGGAFFKEAIAATNKFNGESMTLSKRLGITGEAAATLNTALGDIGSDSETYIGAFDKFAKQIKTNEAGLQSMGLQTRDANGHLRDSQELFTEALQLVGQYKPGLDQTTAAMMLFGKGVDDAMKLQRLNNKVLDEAEEKNKALGMTLTVEGVQASKEYKAAMNDVGDVLTAVQYNIGKAVMPAFTEMATYFASTGPYVVEVFKYALTGLLDLFRAIQLAVKTVAMVAFESFNLLVDQVQNAGEMVTRFLSGDFKGSDEMWDQMKARTKQGVVNVLSGVREAYGEMHQAAVGDMERIWGKGTAVGKPKGGTDTMGDMGGADPKKDKKDPSYMKYYEAALEEERRLATEKDAIHGMSKQAELDYWNNLLQNAKFAGQDQVAVQKKASEARIEVLKQEALQADELGKVNLSAWEARAMNRVAIDEESARNQEALGQITQAALLQQEEQFELRRMEIKRLAVAANVAALDPMRDVVQVAQLNAQLEQAELEHQLRLNTIRGQAAVQSATEQRKVWEDLSGRMSSLWDQGVNAMMNGNLTWSSATRAVGTQLVGWFANSVIKPKVAAWLLGENAQTGATVAGTGMRTAIEGMAAVKSVALWAWAAVKNIMSNAWAAMAAAWQAVVGIPYIGPVLAVGAAAAAFAGVSAIAGRVASAEGGYDIPAGVNPLTQLHEKEMVLPAQHADVIRNMADGGGGGGGVQPAINIHIQALDGQSVRRVLVQNSDALAAAMRAAKRDFQL